MVNNHSLTSLLSGVIPFPNDPNHAFPMDYERGLLIVIILKKRGMILQALVENSKPPI